MSAPCQPCRSGRCDNCRRGSCDNCTRTMTGCEPCCYDPFGARDDEKEGTDE